MLALATTAKGKNLLDDVLRPLARLHDLSDMTPAQIPSARSASRHFAVAEHGAEDIVELMGYAAGERSDRFEPLRLVETGL